MACTILSTWKTSSHLTSTKTLGDRCHYYEHYTHKEPETQSSSVTCPRSNSKHAQPSFGPNSSSSGICAVMTTALCPLTPKKQKRERKRNDFTKLKNKCKNFFQSCYPH